MSPTAGVHSDCRLIFPPVEVMLAPETEQHKTSVRFIHPDLDAIVLILDETST